MFWKAKPTIDADEEEWQILCWQWLLENLGGVDVLRSFPTRLPTQADFPRSGQSGCAHAEFVFRQVAEAMRVDPAAFRLEEQEARIDPLLGPLAVVENIIQDPAGTYRASGNQHLISYDPATLNDLEKLIAVMAHEICHPVLLAIPTPPPGEPEAEEFATDLATVFFGFGVFGGNASFRFNQFRDDASGTQGWATERLGYLSQNEWGFALAVRACLTSEDVTAVEQHASDGLRANFRKNMKYLKNNPLKLSLLTK